MSLQIIYTLLLTLIWSTTALGIKWAVDGIPYHVAFLARFALAGAIMLLIVLLMRKPLPPWRRILPACLLGGVSVSVSMLVTFWAAQSIPSGLIAVLHGLTPLTAVVFTRIWLHERVQLNEVLGIVLAIGGLAVIFSDRLGLGSGGIPVMLSVLAAVIFNSGCNVKLKHYSQNLPAMTVNLGVMLVCSSIGLVFWLLHGAPQPAVWPMRTVGAIVYLAIIGSVLALSVFYWLVREAHPVQLALVPMIATVASLWLGHVLNQESVSTKMLIGTGLVITGLLWRQFGDRLRSDIPLAE